MNRSIASMLFVFAVCGLSGCGQSGPSSGASSGGGFAASESASDYGVADAAAGARAPAPAGATRAVDHVAAEVPASRKAASEHAADLAASGTGDRPFVPNSGRQSGLLTAGSFDDVANYSEFTAMLRNARGLSSVCQSLVSASHRQTLIRLCDQQGNPISNARCIVRRVNGAQTDAGAVELRTGTDGRAMLLTAHHSRQAVLPEQFLLQVLIDGHAKPVLEETLTAGRAWDLTVDCASSESPTSLDLALVIDTTGSMGDELEYLKTEIDSIVASVSRMFPNVDQRYALITYRDNGDEYVCRTFDFTNSLSDLRRNLDAQSAAGGGDFPEAMDVALQSASQLTWRSGQAARVLFLVGDAPPHTGNINSALTAVESLRQAGVRIFPVGASGVEKTAELVLRTASLLTMGQYLFLTDHSGIGNAHATPDVSFFQVERLDRLMLRMIASELAGKRLAAQEIIAIERGERFTRVSPPQPQAHQPTVICCPPVYGETLVVRASVLSSCVQWLRGYGITVLLAIVSGAIVFERLKSCGRTGL